MILTLACTCHFAILHGTGGGGGVMRPLPRDWLLSELELRLKNQRVLVTRRSRWHTSLRSWVNRWPPRSSQWPKNGQNATSPVTSYLSKLDQRFKDQNVPYGLRNTMRCLLDHYSSKFWGSRLKKKSIKIVIFLWCILWLQWPHFDTYEWPTEAKFKIRAPNYPCGHKNQSS